MILLHKKLFTKVVYNLFEYPKFNKKVILMIKGNNAKHKLIGFKKLKTFFDILFFLFLFFKSKSILCLVKSTNTFITSTYNTNLFSCIILLFYSEF